MTFQERYYQGEALDAIFNYFANGGTGNPLVCLPTGTGKSYVIAEFIRRVMQYWPGQRIMCLTHVKELIANNSATLKAIWPTAPFGIYSAGLKKKELSWPITFGGVASVVKAILAFGHIDLLLIDEAHLLSDDVDAMYGVVIQELLKLNPFLKVIGLTATPYRIGLGLLTNGKIFTDIVIDYTSLEKFNQLIRDGFLCPPISKKTTTKIDISKVGISKGDFNLSQLEKAVDVQDTNYLACKEMVEYGYERHKWLIFAAGVTHALHISDMLNSFGIPSIAVYAKMGDEARDRAIKDFKNDKIRCIVNNNVLTTGFDHPAIDFIGMLRPTCSPGLWVQMLGRGTRPSPATGKQNCLVLDFAGNTVRLGPINDPVIPKKRGEGSPGTPPIKICDQCGTYNHANARFCEECGFEFPISLNLAKSAGEEELLRSDMPDIQWLPVERVLYNAHSSQKGENFLKVTYVCTGQKKAFHEFLGLEKGGYAAKRALQWWKQRMGVDDAPPSVGEAMKWSSRLMVPKRIQVHLNKKPYPEITGVEF